MFIHLHIYTFQKLFQSFFAVIDRHTAADLYTVFTAPFSEAVTCDLFRHLPAKLLHIFTVTEGTGQQKLITADPCRPAAALLIKRVDFSDHIQNDLITAQMPESVIDVFEVIDVDQRQRQLQMLFLYGKHFPQQVIGMSLAVQSRKTVTGSQFAVAADQLTQFAAVLAGSVINAERIGHVAP